MRTANEDYRTITNAEYRARGFLDSLGAPEWAEDWQALIDRLSLRIPLAYNAINQLDGFASILGANFFISTAKARINENITLAQLTIPLLERARDRRFYV
jgi:hypothetical protein